MNRHHAVRAVALAAAFALALPAGCSPRATSTPPLPTPGSATAQDPTVAQLTQMAPDDKKSLISSTFPVQVPVPKGEVMRHEAQGDSAWVYGLGLPAGSEGVANWYLEAYRAAEWEVLKNDQNRGSYVLDFQKNGAQSEVLVEPVDAHRSTVTVSVGVGTAILQTQ